MNGDASGVVLFVRVKMNNEVLGLFLKEAVTDRDKKPTNAALGAWRRHFQFKTDIIWQNVIGLAVLHLQFVYALYIWCIYDVKVTTYVFCEKIPKSCIASENM